MNQTEKLGMGWIPDYPDIRDYTPEHKEVAPKFKELGAEEKLSDTLDRAFEMVPQGELPDRVDLRKWCSPVEHQGALESCTAHAAIGLVEFFEQRAFGKYLDASRLFLYKVTRRLLGRTGNVPVYLRTTMKALVLFGVPPEEYWPYDVEKIDAEPPAFCYAYAQSYKAIKYFRLDRPRPGQTELTKEELLGRIKKYLHAGFPLMFGLSLYSSYRQAREDKGRIPFPVKEKENYIGGHALVAVGYNDSKEILNPLAKEPTVGALRIRNSHGPEWGKGGYGWLPYEYVLQGQALDWWSLIKSTWVDSDLFAQD